MNTLITISQLNKYVASKFKEDKKLRGMLICGEISNFTNHQKTGHLYFTLKDKECSVRAVMFSSMASRLNFEPCAGMKVIVSANVQVFERDGIYQLYVNDMQPDGIGALYIAFEQMKKKLTEEGLFDEEFKKPLPDFPENVGIVTSPDAAALQDMLNVISRRYPIVNIRVYPCLVQGDMAPDSICSALSAADNSDNDVIIIGRGGGSFEDLMAFNAEDVARCIFKCKTPVISAVGHETDTTIADYAADLRAPTPSAAAELAVPELSTLIAYLYSFENKLNNILKNKIVSLEQKLEYSEKRLNMLLPSKKAEVYNKILNEKQALLEKVYKNRIYVCQGRLSERFAALDNLSPLKIMNRGYSLVYNDKGLVRSIRSVDAGQKIKIKLCDGEFTAVAEEITEDSNEI